MRIAIIGKDSYIGNALDDYATTQGHTVFQVDALDGKWKTFDFSGIDAVVCVAAIVHRKDITDYLVYHRINTEMPLEIARKAKAVGVRQFVFLSTMAVFGQAKSLAGNIITEATVCEPIDYYGKSKYEAEKLLLAEAEENFKVCIVRPANVYGKGCKGNYMLYFKKIVQILPAIPDAYGGTKQGFIYIENLCRLLYLALKKSAGGIYHAQDHETVSATQLMVAISASLGKKKKTSRLVGLPFRLLRISLTNKLFGGVSYSGDLLESDLGEWEIVDFNEGIKRTFA